MQLLDGFQLSTLQLLDGFNYPLCSYWMISTILYAVTVWFSNIHFAVTGLFSTIHNAVTGWLSTIHYAVTAWFSTNHFAVTGWFSTIHYVVTGWLSTIHYAVTGWFSTIHYAVTGCFSTIHYVVSYWMVVMTISRLLTICTRHYSKETNNKKLQISQPTSLHVLAVVNYLIWPQSSSRSIFDNKKGYIPGVSIIVSLPFTCWAKEDILYRSWRRMVMNIFFFFSGLFMNIFLYRGACIY